MIAELIGKFDWPATAVVLGFLGSVSAIVAALMSRKTTERKLHNDYEIGMAQINRNRDVEMAKIAATDPKMITSHKRREDDA